MRHRKAGEPPRQCRTLILLLAHVGERHRDRDGVVDAAVGPAGLIQTVRHRHLQAIVRLGLVIEVRPSADPQLAGCGIDCKAARVGASCQPVGKRVPVVRVRCGYRSAHRSARRRVLLHAARHRVCREGGSAVDALVARQTAHNHCGSPIGGLKKVVWPVTVLNRFDEPFDLTANGVKIDWYSRMIFIDQQNECSPEFVLCIIAGRHPGAVVGDDVFNRDHVKSRGREDALSVVQNEIAIAGPFPREIPGDRNIRDLIHIGQPCQIQLQHAVANTTIRIPFRSNHSSVESITATTKIGHITAVKATKLPINAGVPPVETTR